MVVLGGVAFSYERGTPVSQLVALRVDPLSLFLSLALSLSSSLSLALSLSSSLSLALSLSSSLSLALALSLAYRGTSRMRNRDPLVLERMPYTCTVGHPRTQGYLAHKKTPTPLGPP